MADALGITKGAVSQWMGAVREQGDEALCAHPHIGAVAKLSAAQRSQIPEFLSHGAESYSFRGEVWTCARVARVIAQEFGVTYHPAHVSRLLKTLEWTPQKPVERATQRDEQQIAAWREETWTELKKKARRERRTLVFVDEAGFYLLPGVVRTYAPCGARACAESLSDARPLVGGQRHYAARTTRHDGQRLSYLRQRKRAVLASSAKLRGRPLVGDLGRRADSSRRGGQRVSGAGRRTGDSLGAIASLRARPQPG